MPEHDQVPYGPPTLPAGAAVVTDVLPLSEPSVARRPGRVAVAATLAVLTALLVGGAVAGWTVLHRPDVRLARALDATRAAGTGAMTLSLATSGPGSETVPDAVRSSSIRYAWGADTQQVAVTYAQARLLDLVATSTHLTLALDLGSVPATRPAAQQLRAMAARLGPDGAVLTALADGQPVGLRIGPGSPLQSLADKAAQGTSTTRSSLSPEQLAALADAVSRSLRDHTVVTDAGSDQRGDHLHAAIDLQAVVADVQPQLRALVPAAGDGVGSADLSGLAGAILEADVWVSDGRVTRVELPLAGLAGRLSGEAAPAGASLTVVAVLDGTGVVPPAGPVTEVPDDLLGRLTEGLAPAA